jgi:hypothetical protein
MSMLHAGRPPHPLDTGRPLQLQCRRFGCQTVDQVTSQHKPRRNMSLKSATSNLRRYFRGLRSAPGELATLRRELESTIAHSDAALVQFRQELAPLKAELGSLHARLAQLQTTASQTLSAVQLVYDDEPANRQRLYELRASSDYALAFTDREPLVSVVIPTFDRHETLCGRAVPSALAQTYTNIEVLVVGECAPPQLVQAINQIADPRLRFINLNRRGPYPGGVLGAWQASGTMPFNEGVRTARGRWLAPLDDDDAFRPHHVASLLDAARAGRWEVATALQEIHPPDGRPSYLIGEFPPRLSQFNLQGTLYHSGLRFMELELATSLFGEPNDWNLCRRWLRAGVRLGLLPVPTVDIFPSWRWDGHDRNQNLQPQSNQDTSEPPA